MKRIYLVYAAVVAGLTLAGVIWAALALHDNSAPALRKLGKGEREFRQARNELVMNTVEPAPLLIKYALQKRNPVRGRVQALDILREIAVQQDLSDQGRLIAPLISEGNRNLALATMRVLAACATIDGADRVAPFLADPDTVLANAAMQALTGSARAMRSRISAASRTGGRAGVDSCLAAAHDIPMPKDDIYRIAGDYFSRIGDTASAGRMFLACGNITSWLLCGPFPVAKWSDVESVTLPETTSFSRASLFPGGTGGTPQGWRPAVAQQGPWFDMWSFMERKAPVGVCLSCFVTVPGARDALLFVNGGDAIMARVNSAPVMRVPGPGGHPAIGEWARFSLKAGCNRILVKSVRQDAYDWYFTARLTDADGNGMEDAKISLEPGKR